MNRGKKSFVGKVVALVSIVFLTTVGFTVSTSNKSVYRKAFAYVSYVDSLPKEKEYESFFSRKYGNPFDVTPSNITREINFDARTGKYILTEKIGDQLYRLPTYMTFDEYLDYKSKEQERSYFQNLNGLSDTRSKRLTNRLSASDPMSKIDLGKSMINRLFGGVENNIKPRGNVDLTLGFFSYQKNEDPNLPPNQQRQLFIPGEFNMRPQLSVDGGIGEKLKLNFNYDNQNTFNFDRQIKLKYDSEQFSEDDIIKKIEAGNVNLPLRGSLIPGVQNLFGLKTDLQFGHLKLSLLAAQQQSRRNDFKIENGSSVQDIEIRPDEYDENRHFFMSHYNRATYEKTLSNLPQINTSYRLAQVEVWISDDRPDYQQGSTMIAAIADLAEPDLRNYTSGANSLNPPLRDPPPYLTDITGLRLPDNRVNPLFEKLASDPLANQLDKTTSVLSGPNYRLKQNRDFEVFRGRLLNQSEYTFNPQLGTLSLNIRLRPNQSLGVSYKYYYTARCDTVFTVGQIASEGLESSVTGFGGNTQPVVTPPKVIFTKMLKSSTQITTYPTWDLMMKNVYNLQTSGLTKEGFDFDIFYEDDFDDGSLKKYIPEEKLRTLPLLQIFGVDKLNRFSDPQPDGVYDYIPGVTVIERTGSIVFPVLEPFGKTLDSVVNDPVLSKKYVYRQLYDTTITIARQYLELNKFVMKARVKASNNNGEYNLGGLFIQRGSVRVTAGGVLLEEGVDYEIDYGIGRLRVTNPSYLAQGSPININYEDNAIFNLQSKNMLGMRAEYAFSKNFSIEGTAMRLWDRPFTQKVNIGDDPINNKMYGIDVNYSNQAPWLTRALDKLPFYSTNAASSVNLFAEAAYMKPGYSSAINLPGEDPDPVVSLDDFEGAINGLTLGGFNTNIWSISSVPSEFPESEFADTALTNVNRALINWYQLDRSPDSRRNSVDRTHPYTRVVDQTELFNREVQIGQTELFTFDVGYYPDERGPYNFDRPGGYPRYSNGVRFDPNTQRFKLLRPENRWGGIMRFFSNPDFEAANYEFIDFWVLNPFMERPDGIRHVEGETGEIVFQLGNVSEDIYKDNLQFYENGMPLKSDPNGQNTVINTRTGRVPINVPVANGFDRGNGEEQDTGYDGLNDEEERSKFSRWLTEMANAAGQPVRYLTEDPSGDNFRYFGDRTFPENTPLLERMTRFNNAQGNAPLNASQGGDQTFLRGNRYPESEDLNNNRSLDQGESYYNYVLKVQNKGGRIDSVTAGPYYKQIRRIVNVNGVEEFWYRFQIPLTSGEAKNISGFRAIQFMRMYFTKFSTGKTFRFADFQLVRSSWRRSPNMCQASDANPNNIVFSIDEVGVEENSGKLPFNYLTPRGIKQERLFGTLTNLLQDEKSISLNFCRLDKNCQVSINKLTKLNLNLYKKLQLFVHLENKEQQPIERGKLALFVRLGKDMVNNYYEYEMPLRESPKNFPSASDSIWLEDNFIDITLSKFKDLKKAKIRDGILELDDPDVPGAKLRIKGVPTLGLVRVMEIGVRNKDQSRIYCGEVWINELRATGLSEDGGFAAQGRLQAQLADLGELNLTGNLSTIGYGGIDKRLQERAQEEVFQYTVSTNLNLGKLLPKAVPINLPLLAQYSKSSTTPLFDPYQLDLTVDELAAIVPEGERDGIYERSRETTTIKSLNLTNVKIEKGDGKKPWSPNNIVANYSYNETKLTDPIIKQDLTSETKIDLEYNYSTNGYNIQPFRKINSKFLKLISEFNFNPLPNRIGFNTGVNRYRNSRAFRFPDVPVFQFDDQRFKWDRNYNLDWDLTKSIRFTFGARSSAIVDELRQVGIADNPADRTWLNELGVDYTNQVRQNPGIISDYRNDNLQDLGRTKNYKHNINLTYTRLPFYLLPLMDWVSGSADYQAEYNWNGGALIYIDELQNLLGNTIQNTQTRSANATLAFDKLYAKSSYLKKIEAENRASATRNNTTQPKTRKTAEELAKEKTEKAAVKEKLPKERKSGQDDGPSSIEKILIRPLLTLRSIKLSYREDLGTSIPGFMPQADLFGLSGGVSPGWQFAAGLQPNIEKGDPNNYLMTNKEWFNKSPNFNDQIIQNERQSFSSKVTLEPIRSFTIDFDFIKNYRKDHTEVFKSKNNDFMQIARYDIGSFEYTNFGMNTIFENSKDLYARFKSYRVTVSERLPNIQGAGQHPDHPTYAQGYGPTSFAVNVPAFLAAYTGQPLDQVSDNLQGQVSALSFIPKPNWNLRYDGLSKVGFFQDFLSSFTLRHSYKSTVGVGKFNTAPDFIDSNPFLTNISNNNYYSQLEIPAVVIQESFSPLIGVQMRTKSNFNLNVEYKRVRNLDLRLNANELTETKQSEIVFGTGYVIQNFKGFTKKSNKRKPKPNADGDDNNTSLVSKANPLQETKNRTLTINFDFSVRDERSDVFRLENDIDPQAQRGQRSLVLKPNIEYQMYKNLTIRFFADYNKNVPYVLNAFPITRFQAGTTVRFIFQ